jgi:chromosome partitioning protein
MAPVYGIAACKGGQGKSTTVSNLARLCALYGARVLVVDLAQPGTATTSLRDIFPDGEFGELSGALMSFQRLAPGATPDAERARAALNAVRLPILLQSQPSWSGGFVAALPWDELLGDAAAYLRSELILRGLLAALAGAIDVVLIDVPAEGGPLLTNALAATDCVIVPLVPETPALEGLETTLRLLARARAAGHAIRLGGILLSRCDPKNKRAIEIVQTLRQSGEVEGEHLGKRLFPFAIRHNEFFEQAYRYGEPIWERSSNAAHWAGYVLLAEWLLRDAGLAHLAATRRGPALLAADTRILDIAALMLPEPEVRLSDFEAAHATPNAARAETARGGTGTGVRK